MSHAPERHEKDCLNCGATVVGRFCHVCGQENVVPKEGFWNLVIHFFYDITHFDSKFFDSLRYLLVRPGFLSKEYIRGRRASYLNPVRMYVFTSAIFFLVFFLLVDVKKIPVTTENTPLSKQKRVELINELEKEYNKNEADSSLLARKLKALKDTTRHVSNADLFKLSVWNTDSNIVSYHSLFQYDSVQNSLPPAKRAGWFERILIRKQIEMTGKYEGDAKEAFLEWIEIFLHKLPYLLFVSLPVFALILKLLYIRRRQFYYVDHT
ncbi:MAG TPA: DUF3667 domain-containing protein, partial [Chitinophagaceae bacterium]|nr:DUF3667 domain-containing protein [Chitinophagaceae bacterium]